MGRTTKYDGIHIFPTYQLAKVLCQTMIIALTDISHKARSYTPRVPSIRSSRTQCQVAIGGDQSLGLGRR